DGDLPAWTLALTKGRRLVFTGMIDRVDLLAAPDGSSALCVVLDYKSSERKVDDRLLQNGVQLRLPAYLRLLRQLAEPRSRFGVARLLPVGVFYVNLRGQYERGRHRVEVLGDREARQLAYRHNGRFDASQLEHLDKRPQIPGQEKIGDQFS